MYGSPCKELSCKEKERNRAVARRVSRLKTWFKKMGVSGGLLGEIQKIERIICCHSELEEVRSTWRITFAGVPVFPLQ